MGKGSKAEQRRMEILAILRRENAVSIVELAERTGRSVATIRRDVAFLGQDTPDVKRLHGAIAVEGLALELGFQEKLSTSLAEKQAIATLVCSTIPDQSVVGLNGGTTTMIIARKLAELERRVTVVTNALNIAVALTGSHIPVIVIGGALRPLNYETTGPAAIDALANLHLDWAVLGANGVHPTFGVSTTAADEAAVGRALAHCATTVCVVADHTKLGHRAVQRMIRWEDACYLATDSQSDGALTHWASHMSLEQQSRKGDAGLWKVRTIR